MTMMRRDLGHSPEPSSKDAAGARHPSPVDVHVGQRLRTRRKMLGMSQEHLAASLGLTFQQVQKYERGANRVSASKLYEAAKALRTPIAYFFEGLSDPAGEACDPLIEQTRLEVQRFLALPEGLAIATQLPRLTRRARTQVAALIDILADGPGPADDH